MKALIRGFSHGLLREVFCAIKRCVGHLRIQRKKINPPGRINPPRRVKSCGEGEQGWQRCSGFKEMQGDCA